MVLFLEIRMVWFFFVQGSSVSKTKTNDKYYQKSDYRLRLILHINKSRTKYLFQNKYFVLDLLICNIKGRRGFIISNACQSVK